MIKELKWLHSDQEDFLRGVYLNEGESAIDRLQKICDTIQTIVNNYGYVDDSTLEIGKRFEKYFTSGWVSLSTPVFKNFGDKYNLPISCNHSILEDSLNSIYRGLHETGILGKYGAGTAVNFSDLRGIGEDISTGGKSNSIIDWVELYADMMAKTRQNGARRGQLTAYLSIDHPEIMSFLDIGTDRIPTEKKRFLNTITTGVSIPIGWRDDLRTNKDKRKVFSKLLNTRKEAGFPYILDLTNSNKDVCQAYIDKNMLISSSNICNEAVEYSDYEKTFACCLSSVNLYYWDEFKNDPNFIFDMNIMLDCVIQEYIDKAKTISGFERAVKFSEEHRAIGLGVTAFCTYLQRNNVAFGSIESFQINNEIFSTLRKESDRASKWMAEVWGEPDVLKGYGLRNTSRIAIAPKKSTTFIDGGSVLSLSEGIEPHKTNYGEKKLANIQFTFKNRELEALLESKGLNTRDTWNSIASNNGSVQHLEFMSEHEKEVFKTFSEISQVDVINLAIQRQKYIDMGQSLNIMIHPDTPAKDIIKLHLDGLDGGIKGFYYQYSINAAQKFSQELMTCSSCEG